MSSANPKTLTDETWANGCATVSSMINRPGKCAKQSCSCIPKPKEPNPEDRLTALRRLKPLWALVDSFLAEYTSLGERYHALSRRARSSSRVHEYGHELMQSEFNPALHADDSTLDPAAPEDDRTLDPTFPELLLEYAELDSTARASSAWRECVDRMEILSEDLTNILEEVRQVVEALEAVDDERTSHERAEDDAIDEEELHPFAAAGVARRLQRSRGRARERTIWIWDFARATQNLRSVTPGENVPFVVPSRPDDGWAALDTWVESSVTNFLFGDPMPPTETHTEGGGARFLFRDPMAPAETHTEGSAANNLFAGLMPSTTDTEGSIANGLFAALMPSTTDTEGGIAHGLFAGFMPSIETESVADDTIIDEDARLREFGGYM